MPGNARAKLAELRARTWSTAAEYEALNSEYEACLAELARSEDFGDPMLNAAKAGVNYRERQDLKRKAARWKSIFLSLNAIERMALLSAIFEAMAESQE